MTAKAKVWATHAVFMALIVACAFIAAMPQVRAIPMAGEALTGIVAWAWGKLGFKPSKAWLEHFMQTLTPAEIVALTTPPPPPAPPAPPPAVTKIEPPTNP